MATTPQFIPRCPSCGYPRQPEWRVNCTECGVEEEPIVALSRAEIRAQLKRMLKIWGAVCLVFPAMTCVGYVSVVTDQIALFVLVGVALGLIAPLGAFIALIGLSAAWTRWALHAYWSIRKGEVGPWSGSIAYAVTFACLLLAQSIGAAVVALGSIWSYPEYPAGWP
jgi:hypothetical protein